MLKRSYIYIYYLSNIVIFPSKNVNELFCCYCKLTFGYCFLIYFIVFF